MELVWRELKKHCSVLVIRKTFHHNCDCAFEEKNTHTHTFPAGASVLGKELEGRLHYTVLISLNKGF